MQDIFDNAFEEVHRSNMSKECITEKEANDTVNEYKLLGLATIFS